jgi:WD40 repeat protein
LGPGWLLDVSADGRLAVLQAGDSNRLVEMATGRELARLEDPDQAASFAVFTQDGTRLVDAAEDGVRVWDLRRIRAELAKLGLDWDAPPYPEAAAEAQTRTDPIEIRVQEPVGEVGRFEGHAGRVWAVVWSGDGRRVYFAGDDKVIRVLNAATRAEVGRLQGHGSRVLSLALSPDGRILLSGSSDATVRVWDTASGKELRRLEGVTGECWGLAFSPDGKHALA